jgi:hypothetical protein
MIKSHVLCQLSYRRESILHEGQLTIDRWQYLRVVYANENVPGCPGTFNGVSDGSRTRGLQDHNLAL